MPGVEIKAVYEIIVSHAPEQGICTLNRAIPASPPQCLTVTEEINIKFNLLRFVIPTERFKSIIVTFLYNPTEFMQAMGIKMFALEKPIALQLACISS